MHISKCWESIYKFLSGEQGKSTRYLGSGLWQLFQVLSSYASICRSSQQRMSSEDLEKSISRTTKGTIGKWLKQSLVSLLEI